MNLILPFSSHWNCESYLSTKASILTFRACMSVHFTLHYNFLWPPIKVSIGLWIQAMMCGFQLECIPISAVIWYPRGRYSFEFKSFTVSKHPKHSCRGILLMQKAWPLLMLLADPNIKNLGKIIFSTKICTLVKESPENEVLLVPRFGVPRPISLI